MRISRLRLRNWRNFKDVEIPDLPDIVYLLGQNASGKSNLLDALHFLMDVAKPEGGGLQHAVGKRGGMRKLRCLHARGVTDVEIEVDISGNQGNRLWTYSLCVNSRRGDTNLAFVKKELLIRHSGRKAGAKAVDRVHGKSEWSKSELRETHLEQSSISKNFASLARYLGSIRYFHLVPQILKFGDQIGGRVLENDPFGQNFIKRISQTDRETRSARLKEIESSLKRIIPQLEHLGFAKDKNFGTPHLEFRFPHHRPCGAIQREDQFSDGTLRLIAILWTCHEFSGYPILIEEPELSLNNGIVKSLHWLFKESLEGSKKGGQLFMSTRNGYLLSNAGINTRSFVIIYPSKEGSKARKASEKELRLIKRGFSADEAILPEIDQQNEKLWEVIHG